jgi:hypothetical protein
MTPGPPPKLPHRRRRTNVPAHGEWTHVRPPDKPVLPKALPRRTKGEGE